MLRKRPWALPLDPAAFEKAGETFAIMSFIASVNKYPTRARKHLLTKQSETECSEPRVAAPAARRLTKEKG